MQKQFEARLKVPAQLQQIAETQHMGECVAVYPRKFETYPIPVAIFVTFLVGLATLALPLTILSWSFYLLLLLLLFLTIYVPLFRARIIHRQDQIVLYAAGFITFLGRVATAYRWETIESVLRGTAQSEGEGIGDIDEIVVKAGTKKCKLSKDMSQHARADLCDRVERGYVSYHLPHVIARYNGGEEIAFGSTPADTLFFSQAGFRDAQEALPWALVEKAEVGPALIVIRKEGRTSDWYHKLICNVPNAALLKALLEYQR
ncbi:MAG TPA: DUF6585 family protein [Ktedonobacteraceae bacterium]